MEIKTSEKDGIHLLAIKGRMDLSEIALLDEKVNQLRAFGHKWFVLNLIDVTEITSSGVGRVLNIQRTLEGDKGGLALADVSAVVEYVLELARLNDIFPTFATEADAIDYLKKQRNR